MSNTDDLGESYVLACNKASTVRGYIFNISNNYDAPVLADLVVQGSKLAGYKGTSLTFFSPPTSPSINPPPNPDGNQLSRYIWWMKFTSSSLHPCVLGTVFTPVSTVSEHSNTSPSTLLLTPLLSSTAYTSIQESCIGNPTRGGRMNWQMQQYL